MKKICAIMAIMAMSMAVLTGCASEAENIDNDVVSEAVSESMSDTDDVIASEKVEEEAAQETSEEIVEEVDYSADTVMALCDELSQKYQYDDPEYIKSLVIAANLDYITEEDLEIILSTYGYTMEDLAVIYEEGMISSAGAYLTTYTHMSGSTIEFDEQVDYANRVLFQDVMLNPGDKELAALFDEYAIAHNNDEVAKFWLEEPTTSCEILLSAASDTFRFGGVWETPYADYIQEDIE